MSDTIKFGTFITNQVPAEADHPDVVRRLVERAVHAENSGFGSVFVIEHVGSDDYAYYEPLTLLTSVAEHTERVQLGQGIILAPFYNPIRLATRIATLDNLSNGRAMLGLGTGYRASEFETFEVPYDERVPRTLETIDIVQQLWNENNVTHDGTHFQFEDLTIHPKPVQDEVSVWLGLFGDWGLDYLARSELTWWSISMLPDEFIRDRVETYAEALEEHGRSIDDIEVPMMIETSIAETHDAAVEAIRNPVVEKYREYASRGGLDVKGGKGGPHLVHNPTLRNLDDPDDLTFDMIEDLFVVGTPEEVIEQIEEYREMGFNHIIIRPPVLQMDEEKVRDTLDLYGEEVIPHFQE